MTVHSGLMYLVTVHCALLYLATLHFPLHCLHPVGPGNKFVAEAKRQLFGRVGIDQV